MITFEFDQLVYSLKANVHTLIELYSVSKKEGNKVKSYNTSKKMHFSGCKMAQIDHKNGIFCGSLFNNNNN